MTRPEPKYQREIAVSAWDRALVDGPQVYEWCYRSRTGVDMLSGRPPPACRCAGATS